MVDHKDYWTTDSEEGKIKISEDVIASIAALSAAETDGVCSLSSSLTSDIVGFLSNKNLSKGVRVELYDTDCVKIELGLLATFGHNICEVAKAVQHHVKSSIESMTGLRAVEVNVNVGGVSFAPMAQAEEEVFAET